MISSILSSLRLEFLETLITILYATSPIWLPILLAALLIESWIHYSRLKAVVKEGGILLEIKLPREVFKTPIAMELILTSLYLAGKGTYIDTFVEGKHRPYFSLEIVSINGEVHFYVWTKPKFKTQIEAQFYAQYPGVEVNEVEDYAKDFHLDRDKTGLVGLAFKLGKADVYPLKTYIDYGLDKEQEEESKTDPITAVLEFLGSIKAGEQVWIQILIQAHRKLGIKEDAKWAKDDWKKEAEAEIKKKIDEFTGAGDKKDDTPSARRVPTKVEQDLIVSMQRNLNKLPFETVIRGIYAYRSESFNIANISGLIGSFRQYSAPNLNEIRVGWGTGFDYPWQDFKGVRKAARQKEMLEAYKLRSYFQGPHKGKFTKHFILTTEELATLFHIPGSVVSTPTVTKISSRKSDAPSNLPI
jgi:hypothetical protein